MLDSYRHQAAGEEKVRVGIPIRYKCTIRAVEHKGACKKRGQNAWSDHKNEVLSSTS